MKKSPLLKLCIPFFAFLLIFLTNSCAPVFSEFQDARTVGKSKAEFSGSYSGVRFIDTEDDASGKAQDQIDVQAGFGLTDKIDIRARYTYAWIEDLKGNVLSVGPKFSLLKDRISAFVPLGVGIVSDEDSSSTTWQIHPTLLTTFPVGERVDINPSLKYLIALEEDSDNLVAINLGLGIKVNDAFIFRPEYGILMNPGESGYYSHFGFGMTFKPGAVTEE